MDADGQNPQNLTGSIRDNWAPSWSPDGKRIAFTAAPKDGDIDIYVMDADGQNRQNLTNNPTVDKFPSWSPDGKRIAFVSDRDGNLDIYVMDTNGEAPQNLTNTPLADESHPAWYHPWHHPASAVAPVGKQFTTWGWLKQVAR